MHPFDNEQNNRILLHFQQKCLALKNRIQALQQRNQRLSDRLEGLMKSKQAIIDKTRKSLY
ncbi:hypothetical protein GCM10027347_56930 [Larkinella harenae]